MSKSVSNPGTSDSMRKASTDYADLKRFVVTAARDEMNRTKPLYVAEFRDVLLRGGNLEQASRAAAKYLGSGFTKWSSLLTAFFDVEFVRSKVVDCHELLRRNRDSTSPDAGFWFSYHLDHWVFQSDAFMDRCDKVLKQTIRQVIRPLDPKGWHLVERAISSDVKTIKDNIGRVRNPLAHGLGGGVVGIINQWEPILAAPFDVFDDRFAKDSVGAFHGTVSVTRRRLWYRAVHRSNILMFAYSEAFSGKVLAEIRARST